MMMDIMAGHAKLIVAAIFALCLASTAIPLAGEPEPAMQDEFPDGHPDAYLVGTVDVDSLESLAGPGGVEGLDEEWEGIVRCAVGIESYGGGFDRWFGDGGFFAVPVSCKKAFTTAADNQRYFGIHVLKGRKKEAAGNTSLGILAVHDFSPAPLGVPAISVTMHVDGRGRIWAWAEETNTARKLSITDIADYKE